MEVSIDTQAAPQNASSLLADKDMLYARKGEKKKEQSVRRSEPKEAWEVGKETRRCFTFLGTLAGARNMAELCADSLGLCFAFLDAFGLCACVVVCARWRAVLDRPDCVAWHRRSTSLKCRDVPAEESGSGARRVPALLCRNARGLEVCGYCKWACIPRSLRLLEVRGLGRSGDSGDVIKQLYNGEAQAVRGLRVLMVLEMRFTADRVAVLGWLVERVAALRRLELSGIVRDDVRSSARVWYEAAVGRMLPDTLEHLALNLSYGDESELNGALLRRASALPNLQVLELRNCERVADIVCALGGMGGMDGTRRSLASLKTLRTVRLSGSFMQRERNLDYAMAHWLSDSLEGGAPQLEELELGLKVGPEQNYRYSEDDDDPEGRHTPWSVQCDVYRRLYAALAPSCRRLRILAESVTHCDEIADLLHRELPARLEYLQMPCLLLYCLLNACREDDACANVCDNTHLTTVKIQGDRFLAEQIDLMLVREHKFRFDLAALHGLDRWAPTLRQLALEDVCVYFDLVSDLRSLNVTRSLQGRAPLQVLAKRCIVKTVHSGTY